MSELSGRPVPPPSLAGTPVPILPRHLWPQLKAPQQAALLQLLSDLVARRLLPPTPQEAIDDPH
jgi:hypothetical protein